MNSAAGPKSLETVELHCQNLDGQVRIVPPDNDIMVLSVESAIKACRAFNEQIVFKNQFDLLLERLAGWIGRHHAKIADAYLTVRDSGLLFLAVQQTAAHDTPLDDALTQLDLEVANDPDFSLISMAVHSIPRAAQATIESFVSPKLSLRYRFDAK